MEKKPNAIKRFFGEFKKFITRGNVVDMAVGVIVGGAFTGIVNGLSNYVLKPLINALLALIFKGDGLAAAITPLSMAYQLDENGQKIKDAITGEYVYDLANSIYIDWGSLINAIINFVLIAFVLFLIVRTINKVAEANKNAQAQLRSEETKEIKKIRKENKISWKEAKAIYAKRVAEAEAKAAEEARIAEEEAKAKAAEEARIAEEKAMANTVLLSEIRDLMKKSLGIEDPVKAEENAETAENAAPAQE